MLWVGYVFLVFFTYIYLLNKTFLLILILCLVAKTYGPAIIKHMINKQNTDNKLAKK